MAVDALTTAVNTLIDRVVVLEPLSVAQITASVPADKMWLWNSPSAPFWGNRPIGLTRQLRGDTWTLTISARLWLSHVAGGTVGTTTPQDLSWQYIPEVLRYFDAVRTSLAPAGYAEIAYIAPAGISITCPTGMDLAVTQHFEAFYIDFQLVVPFHLVGT